MSVARSPEARKTLTSLEIRAKGRDREERTASLQVLGFFGSLLSTVLEDSGQHSNLSNPLEPDLVVAGG
ncbi:hypothetical protein [Synechococcus sp. MIT S1220]|uniref:hypothetical protein n=1 Tax=Synechococcus sp. MIT S1220 TaxID=3082549 RepID=UPI0039AF4C78